MNAATIVSLVVARVLKELESALGVGTLETDAKKLLGEVTAKIKSATDQMIIELRFAEMDLQLAKGELERMIQKEEEEQALARGRANALPDVEIVPPDDGETK